MAAVRRATRTLSVYCDETGAHDCDYFAWGSIWCPAERVKEFEATVDRLAQRHKIRGETGWKFNSGRNSFHHDLVRWFFKQPWLCFQSFFVCKKDMHIFSDDDCSTPTAYKKLLCTLIATQAARFDRLPGGPRRFRVHVDQVGEHPSKAAEEYQIVAAAIRKGVSGRRAPLATFKRIDSRSSRGIQLADLLVGAIRSQWEYTTRRGQRLPKRTRKIQAYIAECLGWPDLWATTPKNLKFNVWLHHDSRGFKTRGIKLKYPAGNPEPIFESARR